MSHCLAEPVTSINGYRVKPGMYDSVLLPSDEQLREELERIKLCWTTPEQRRLNAHRREHEHECHRCHGKGYTKKDKNTGCTECRGTGWLSNS